MHLFTAFWLQAVVCTQLCEGKEEHQLREEPHPKDSNFQGNEVIHKGARPYLPSLEAGGRERERET